MSKLCPKCGYQRQPTDPPPDYECPRCGIVYARYRGAPADAPAVDDKVDAVAAVAATLLPTPTRYNTGKTRRALFAIAILMPVCLVGLLYHYYMPVPNRGMATTPGLSLNGHGYDIKLNAPVAEIRLHESGFQEIPEYVVIWPLAAPGSHGFPGIELSFKPERIVLLEPVAFHAQDPSGIRLSFHPLQAKLTSAGDPVETSYLLTPAGGRIQFEVLEPHFGGRVEGKILEAELEAHEYNVNSGQPIQGKERRVLTLRDMPFAGVFQRAAFQ